MNFAKNINKYQKRNSSPSPFNIKLIPSLNSNNPNTINRELNKSESSSKRFSENQRNNVFYVKNDKYIEKRINNIHTKNINKEENNNEKSNKSIIFSRKCF